MSKRAESQYKRPNSQGVEKKGQKRPINQKWNTRTPGNFKTYQEVRKTKGVAKLTSPATPKADLWKNGARYHPEELHLDKRTQRINDIRVSEYEEEEMDWRPDEAADFIEQDEEEPPNFRELASEEQ